MLSSRSTSRLPRSTACIVMPRKSAMCRSLGRKVVVRMPKQPVVILGPVFICMVDIDIRYVLCQIIHEFEPASVSGERELAGKAIDGIVLIVVVGDQWRFARRLVQGFMVRENVTEVAPAVLIDYFPFLEEVGGAIQAFLDQGIERIFVCNGFEPGECIC